MLPWALGPQSHFYSFSCIVEQSLHALRII